MILASATLPRFTSLCGWTNRILRVNLDTNTITTQETAPYVPDFLAARGLAAKLAWDEYPEPIEPFDRRNPLMVFAGALTGTRSAYSGRCTVATFSPQGYPYHWFTRSNIGGHFGGELKRAGYDGLVVVGAADTPVRIMIRDDQVSILPADELWGQDALETLEAIEAIDGKGVRSMAIGPAGEHLSCIATIQTASSSACGHGGFGAVMGSKKLKTISVLGTGSVRLADEERVLSISKALGDGLRAGRHYPEHIKRLNERLAQEGGGSVRAYACTESCPTPCNLYYRDVPGVVNTRTNSGHWACVGTLLAGMNEQGAIPRRGVFDFRLGTRAGLEMNALCNRYGLNQWDLIIGMVPWLEACQRAGLLTEMNGQSIDFRSPTFWAMFLHALAYREGLGDALANGGWAAARKLNLGENLMRRYYTAWGHAGHWDGHGDLANYVVYPYWLVPILQWMTDTRDPIPSGHDYVWKMMATPALYPNHKPGPEDDERWRKLRALGERLYGDSAATDPYGGYQAKGKAGYYHIRRSVIKDNLPGDDFVLPWLFDPSTADGQPMVAGIPGPLIEYNLFIAGTGVDWSEDDFNQAAERVYALERAIQVRHWGRDRAMDEMVLPSFDYPENWPNPLLGERHALDRQAMGSVIDEYYTCLGWDVTTGWPTRERLTLLGLRDVYEPMMVGAARALASIPRPDLLAPIEIIEAVTERAPQES
ncbi:MAG: aldehyde ferredoxin oxidoreductase N-terminal domain-containing protein [Anaerolineae bacterium]